MPLAIPILSLDDPRVWAYRNLRERSLRDEGLFITEGALLAERLLQSRFPIESLLVAPQSEARFAALVPDDVPVYVAEPALLREIVGFDFHRGVLGLGRRLPFPSAPDLVGALSRTEMKWIACPSTETAENLGLILRSGAAFGVCGVLLPSQGADPLSRRCLRQSMGLALSLPITLSHDLLREVREAKLAHGLRLVAAVAGTSEGREVVPLHRFTWPARSVLVVGNEFRGLDEEWLGLCDNFVTIPLAPGCDSLNVAVATGILLHHMRSASIEDY